MNIIHYLFAIVVISKFQQYVEGQKSAGCVRPRIENGRAKVRARGKMVYFRCRKKFTRIGPKFAVCLPNGVWSQPAPICIGRGCPTIVHKDGLQISGEYDGAMLKFTCPAGMRREGPESIHCNGKKWNADQPSCVVGISLQCDFEQEELCGWSQSDNDDFEWTWFSGKTPTVNTGPLHDHTHAANSSGHYLFIESSSPRKPLDRAVLASPLYQAKYSNTCFEFWYHMQGPEDENAVGSLEVFVKPESLKISDIDPEFIMEGNQGVDWKRGSIYIKGQTEVFQIIIVGTRKEAFVSDIAIDDVRMYNCSEDSITDETGDMTTEATSSDGQSSDSTQTITIPITAISSDKTTKTVTNTSTQKPTTAGTTMPTAMATKPRKISTTNTKTTLLITSSMKRTPEPKTTTVRTTQIKTTMSPLTTLKTTMRKTTSKSTRRQKQTKTTKIPTTFKPTIPQKTMKSTLTGKHTYKTTLKSTKKMIASTTSSVYPSTPTPISKATTKTTKSSSSQTSLITPVIDAIKPETSVITMNTTQRVLTTAVTMNTTQSISSPVTWQGMGNTTDALTQISNDGTPLIVGISCGIAVVVLVIAVLACIWARRQRNKLSDETIEEMAPITNAEGGYYHPS